MKTKQFILVLLALFASVTAKGFRIDVGDDEDHLWLTLTVLNEDQKTAEVTSTDYAWGTCTIPAAADGYTIVSIGDNAFKNQTDLVEVVIPNTVTSIGASAFEGCTALGTLDHPVVVPASVTSVGVDAFKGTWWLDNTLPNGVIYINNILYIYKGEMPANTAIDIAEGTTTILSGAFKDCTGLTSVTIPATVTAIGSQAFDGCSSLTSVTVNNPTPVGISSNTFSNAANATLWVPNFEAYNAYRANNNWSYFKRITASIPFADETIKGYCIQQWDTDENGELEFDEAAAVGTISSMFNDMSASSFTELQYFTNLTSISSSFRNFHTEELIIPGSVTLIRSGGSDNISFDGANITRLIFANGSSSLLIGYNSETRQTMFRNSKIETLVVGRDINYYTIFKVDYPPFQYAQNLKELVFTEGVIVIHDKSFQNCTSLESVTFSNTITSIGVSAFSGCSSLISIDIPNSVTIIGNSAFSGCLAISSLFIPASVENIGNYAFSNCSELKSLRIVGETIIGDGAFATCEKLIDVNLGENVTQIGQSAFSQAVFDLVIIPSSVTSITGNPFPVNSILYFKKAIPPFPSFSCSDTNLIIVPEDAVDAYRNTWSDIASYLIIPESALSEKSYNVTAKVNSSALVEAIGEANTLNVLYLKVSGTINSYDMMVMRNKLVNLRELDLSEASIEANNYNYGTGVSEDDVFPDFLNTTKLISLKLPNTITTIGQDAFHSTSLRLTSITIPASVRTIESDAFRNGSITTVELSEDSQLYSIGNSAFKYLPITSFYLPQSITNIGDSAFYGTKLKDLDIQLDHKVKIGSYAYASTPLRSITLKNVTLSSWSFNGCGPINNLDLEATSLTGLTQPFGNCNITNASINVASGIGSYTFYASTVKNLIIWQGSIGSEAFKNFTSLESVDLKENVTSIGASAFYGCTNLKTIKMPETLNSIGSYAFCNTKISNIRIPKSVKVINKGTFSNCQELTSVILSPATSVISALAFENCTGITEMHLPSTLETIGNDAFTGCTILKTIYAYMPDIITIGSSTFPNYKTSTLYVPSFLYNSYYYDTNWSQFLHIYRCDLQPGDYETFYTNGDILFADGEERITTDTPIATIGSRGSITVEGEAQAFDTVDQTVDADYSASLIGDGEGDANNMPMNELRVNIAVTAGKWYFFCFPFDVTIASCTYPGRYAWRSYDGATRAANGSGGWKKVTAETLNAREGYAFQSETTGTLTVRFSAPTFGGNRTCELEVHSASNAQNASWNFVGNPYSSYYDFGTSDITSPITVWTGSSYTAYRPGDDELHLRPYQAFFVQKPEAANSIQFNAERRESYRQSQRAAASRAFARSAENVKSNRMFLDIVISDNDTAALDRTRLVLNEKAQRSYELDCDAAKFMADNATAQVYMMEDGQPMAINERPVKGDIRLGYIAKNKGTLSIKAQRMDLPMLLIDLVTGTEYDLSNGVYEFSTEAGTFNNRFMLRLSGEATAIRNLANETGVTISKTKGGLNVAGAEGKTVEVYNVGGSLVSCQNNGFISLPTGIYLVKVNDKSVKISVK